MKSGLAAYLEGLRLVLRHLGPIVAYGAPVWFASQIAILGLAIAMLGQLVGPMGVQQGPDGDWPSLRFSFMAITTILHVIGAAWVVQVTLRSIAQQPIVSIERLPFSVMIVLIFGALFVFVSFAWGSVALLVAPFMPFAIALIFGPVVGTYLGMLMAVYMSSYFINAALGKPFILRKSIPKGAWLLALLALISFAVLTLPGSLVPPGGWAAQMAVAATFFLFLVFSAGWFHSVEQRNNS